MIIFPNFDGVLHDYEGTAKDLFRHAPRFSAVLCDHVNIEVVISSDWRKDAGSVANWRHISRSTCTIGSLV